MLPRSASGCTDSAVYEVSAIVTMQSCPLQQIRLMTVHGNDRGSLLLSAGVLGDGNDQTADNEVEAVVAART